MQENKAICGPEIPIGQAVDNAQDLAKKILFELENIDKKKLSQRTEQCVCFYALDKKTKDLDIEVLVCNECKDFLKKFRKSSLCSHDSQISATHNVVPLEKGTKLLRYINLSKWH